MTKDPYKKLSRPLLPAFLLLLATTAGAALGRHITLSHDWIFATACLMIASGLVASIRCGSPLWLLCSLLFLRGFIAVWGSLAPEISPHHILGFANGQRYTITGRVNSDPSLKGNRQVFLLEVLKLSDANQDTEKIEGMLRVSVYGSLLKFKQGTLIRFTGKLKPLRNFKNPGAFDYRQYMAFQDVYAQTYTTHDRVTVIEQDVSRTPACLVEKIRNKAASAIDESVKEQDRAEVLKALTVGMKNGIPKRTRDAFVRSGTAHLLAISGLHLGIVAALVFWLSLRLFSLSTELLIGGQARKCAALATLFCISAYGFVAGMSPSTQRAVIMVAVFLLSFVVEKEQNLLNTLAAAALVILAIRPTSLFSVSFQLSFGAVLFIILGVSATGPSINGIENRMIKAIVSFVLVSVFAIAGTMPLAAHHFSRVSGMGVVSNCLLVPLVGFGAVPLGLLGTAAHFIHPDAGAMLLTASAELVGLAIFIAEKIAQLPGSSFLTVTPNIFETACLYASLWGGITLLGRFIEYIKNDETRKGGAASLLKAPCAAVLLIALCLLALDAAYWMNRRFLNDVMRVTFLDVGQGNAAVLELPGGKTALIDGGGFPGEDAFDTGASIVAPFLLYNKIRTVDLMILTHPDTDHVAGLAYIAENFNVGTIWTNGQQKDSREYERFIKAAEKCGAAMPPYSELFGTHRIGDVTIELLHPPPGFLARLSQKAQNTTNDNSLVARISFGKISLLFPGDLQKRGEEELVRSAGDRLASTVLLAPHHGSRTSGTKLFLSHLRPKVVVISAGWENRYGYPNKEALDRYREIGAKTYRTDMDGAVVIRTDGERLDMETPCQKGTP